MSKTTLRSIEYDLQEVSVQVAWAQWSSLGGGGLQDAEAASTSIVDPEALLLLSLYLIPVERRLRDLVRWWADAGSELLSVQRTKTLLEDFPSETSERLGAFAHWAVEAGDKRWRRYAAPDSSSELARDRKGRDHPTLDTPPSLLLRLRAGFGVSAKADVLAYLLGSGERSASTQEATGATAYSRATVRSALRDLSRAGFIEETTGRPVRYFAPLRPWMDLLWSGRQGPPQEEPPTWRHWGSIFAFLAQALRWAHNARDQSEYVMSTRARDVFEAHEEAFVANRIPAPNPDHYSGADYVEGFARTVEALTQWIPEHL